MTTELTRGAAESRPTAAVQVAAAADSARPEWSGTASLFGYFVPGSQNYGQPTLGADRGPWHLEGRYNYEALETGSAWLGYTFSAGRELRLDVTPMMGGVFGDLHGIAPGCELTLHWSRLELYSEGEYFFDSGQQADDFFYNWSELSYSTSSRWRAGLALQRTRAYESSLDYQPGLLAGASWERFDLTAYLFNLGWEDPTVVIAAQASF